VAWICRDAVRWFWRHDGLFLAAGLSFYVVICVVPFALLLMAGGGFLLSDERVVRGVVAQITEILPVYQTDVEEILTNVARARRISGLLGTGILLLFASQLFAATRFVLNRMLGLKGRSFVGGLVFDLGMMVILTLMFFVTMAITAGHVWMKGVVTLSGHGLVFTTFFAWTGLFLAVVFDTGLFVTLYRFVPIERLGWTNIIAGSVVTAVLWEIAKQLFRFYIEGIGVYSTMYGSLGVTIGLIMWIYYSAVVFVLGAALIRALEERRRPVAVV
jgi:membrane protein